MAKPAPKPAAKPGLLSRLFGKPAPAPKPERRYHGPAKTEAEKLRLRTQLAQQIKTIRAKLDPRLLRLAEKIAKKGPPTTDQERAQLAIELFLAQRKDGGDFAAKLKTKLEEQKRRSH